MDDIHPHTEIAAPEVLPSIFLDREGVRARVSSHLARGEPIEALGIERNRPVNTHDFAFVGRAPKRSSQTNWYRCSFCQTDRKFSAGRIVLSSDGLLRLIGDDCWDKHLDRDRYRQEAQDWSNYEQKRLFARIREQIVPSIAFVTQKVREVLNESINAIHFAEKLPHTLRIGAPLLFSRLEQAQRNSGRLQVERVVRDYGALERTGSERFVYRAETLHIVIGLEGALGPVPQIEVQLREALTHFYNARNSITETNWQDITNAHAARLITKVREDIQLGMRAISLCASALGRACDFLSVQNIRGMVRWCSDSDCDCVLDDVSLRSLPDGFQFYSATGDFVVRRPSQLMPGLLPDTEDMERMLDLT